MTTAERRRYGRKIRKHKRAGLSARQAKSAVAVFATFDQVRARIRAVWKVIRDHVGPVILAVMHPRPPLITWTTERPAASTYTHTRPILHNGRKPL